MGYLTENNNDISEVAHGSSNENEVEIKNQTECH